MPLTFNSASTLLFVGDSITDCGRGDDPETIGFGYVRVVRDALLARDPANGPRVINVGISGNKVTDLAARWSRDVIAHRADVVSVMIGVNDVWHGLVPAWRPGVAIDKYIATYREILLELRAQRPTCRLVLCEPTVISPPAPKDGNTALAPYVRAVNDLARDFAADAVVPTHGKFLEAERLRSDVGWTTDGVHPTSIGHMLIARMWLEATASR